MNLFSKIRGQQRALQLLETAVKSGKAGGSYLFYGNDGIGKFTSALYFGMALNCTGSDKPCGKCNSCKKFLSLNHPDMIYLFPTPNIKFQLDGSFRDDKFAAEYESFRENRRDTPWKQFHFSQKVEIRIDAVRMLIHRVNMSTNEAKVKVCLIEDVDLMNNNTANAFLKTLEEPPKDTIILLTSSRQDYLLPTILSRCQKIPFNPLAVEDIQDELLQGHGLEASKARMLARIANGSMEKALQLIEVEDDEQRQTANRFKEIITSHNDLEFYRFLSENKGNSPVWLSKLIMHLQIALADLAFFEYKPEYIVNIDRTHLIEKMYHSYPGIDAQILDQVRFLESCEKKLKGNVNQQLILIEIYNKFTRLFG